MKQPAMNASVRKVPDSANESAVSATPSTSGLSTSVDVTNTTTASGTRITAIVRNWRLR